MLFRVWYLQSQSNKNTPCRTVRIFTRTVRTFIAVFVLSVSTLFDSVWQGLPFLQPPSPHIFVALCQKRPLSSTSNYRRLGFVCELCIGTSISKSPGLKVDNPPPLFSFPHLLSSICFCLQEQLDVALSKTCKHFDVSHYTKVHLAYTLLGKTQVSCGAPLQGHGNVCFLLP